MNQLTQQDKRIFQRLTMQQFFDKFTQVVEIGQGNFGFVSKAIRNNGEVVAIKQFNPQALKYFHMVKRQIKNLRLLKHPNILQFYDCYLVNDERYFMVTQYCNEGSLSDYIKNNPKLDFMQKLQLCKNISEGLAAAHHLNIVHRDLKPDNILISSNKKAKIGDFGSSTTMDNSEMLRSMVGSPTYMDANVRNNQRGYDKFVDIYSMGLVFYYIFKGEGLFDDCCSMNQLTIRRKLIYDDYYNKTNELMAEFHPFIKDIIQRCLIENSQNRPTADEIAKTIIKKLGSEFLSTNSQSIIEPIQEGNMFVSKILSYHELVNKKQLSQSNRIQVIKLLIANKQNITLLCNIQELLFVNEATKAQFCFWTLFYYFKWLNQLSALVENKISELKNQYSHIDSQKLNQESKTELLQYINPEMQRIRPLANSICGKIRNQLKLIDNKTYFPQNFRETVAKNIKDIAFQNYKLQKMQEELKTFFNLRIAKEYKSNKRQGVEEDNRKNLLWTMCNSFV